MEHLLKLKKQALEYERTLESIFWVENDYAKIVLLFYGAGNLASVVWIINNIMENGWV